MHYPTILGTTLSIALSAAVSAAAELDVVVEGLTPEGRLMLAVVQEPSGWSDDAPPLCAINARVTGPTMKFRLEVPDGKVAIRLFHDTNANGELDTNLLGIPKEGYGFSQNPKVRGPASFEDAAFEVNGPTSTIIRVK